MLEWYVNVCSWFSYFQVRGLFTGFCFRVTIQGEAIVLLFGDMLRELILSWINFLE